LKNKECDNAIIKVIHSPNKPVMVCRALLEDPRISNACAGFYARACVKERDLTFPQDALPFLEELVKFGYAFEVNGIYGLKGY